jgi:hypothetical protein
MRTLQVVVFGLGLASFVAAIFFIGDGMGDVLWRGGVATLLIDLVLVKLWPASSK